VPLPAPMAASRAKPEMTRAVRPITILLAAAALFAAAVPAAQASPAALQTATSDCWRDVVNDWLNHQPNVVGTYAIPCYTQAIQHLNQYSDIAGYSSAPDDIQRALLAAIRDQRGGGGPSGGGAGPSASGGNQGPGGGGGGSNDNSSGGGKTGGGGLGGVLGVHDATSVPLPLIVLGALAVLLALAALATWLARRFQERRPQPAPAVSRRR
jgi:hypothetical protein